MNNLFNLYIFFIKKIEFFIVIYTVMNSNQKYSIIFKDIYRKIKNLPDGKPKDLLIKLRMKLIKEKNDITLIAEFFEKEKNDDIFKSESHIFELIIAII